MTLMTSIMAQNLNSFIETSYMPKNCPNEEKEWRKLSYSGDILVTDGKQVRKRIKASGIKWLISYIEESDIYTQLFTKNKG